MTEQFTNDLNQRFGAPDRIRFYAGPGGYTLVDLEHDQASATVALEGAQVLTYTPRDQEPVLFVSQQATYIPGKSVRGGVPVCWPWFGGVRNNPDRPFHGFARMLRWDVLGVSATDDTTTLELGLQPSETTRYYWPHSFELRLLVHVGSELRLDLVAHNTNDQAIELTGALHTYFRVGDIDQVTIYGLENATYIDKLDSDQQKQQQGPVHITGSTDRIYISTDATCVIDDAANKRTIIVEKQGSNSTVVWNPWIDNTPSIADMADEEYREMVCVETTNAGPDSVVVAAGGEHILTAVIRVETGDMTVGSDGGTGR